MTKKEKSASVFIQMVNFVMAPSASASLGLGEVAAAAAVFDADPAAVSPLAKNAFGV